MSVARIDFIDGVDRTDKGKTDGVDRRALKLRPYQQAAVDAVAAGWAKWDRQLGVAATGAGKTVIFAHIAKQWVAEGSRVLVLAHRGELVDQAISKLAAWGVWAQKEMGGCSATQLGVVVVGSVQTFHSRLDKWPEGHFDLIILDEAHHCLSATWGVVLMHFKTAKVLGVTATPSRSDKRELGEVFQGIAFEVGLLDLIRDGYLCEIRATKLAVELPLSAIRGDYSLADGERALKPHLAAVAVALAAECWDKKLLVFLPLVETSLKFCEALNRCGLEARHVDGSSGDRAEALRWYAEPGPRALCNAMLLTEGFDQPDINAICCLRPTKSGELYMQIVGRGTRLAEGKNHVTLYDPLWLTGDHKLCRPASIIASSALHAAQLQERLNEGLGLLEAEELARVDVEKALEAQLKAAKKKKAPRGWVDPVHLSICLGDADLADYEPTMPWEMLPATPDQVAQLDKLKIHHEGVMTAGLAAALLERVQARKKLGLASPAQVLLCRRLGERNADRLTATQAGMIISRRVR